MAIESDLKITRVEGEGRERLEPILKKSFEGWYLRHSRKMLRDVEEVYAATLGSEDVGLVMLKPLNSQTGYVYYIAVSPEHRGRKISSVLLDFSIKRFLEQGMNLVYASVSEDNVESNALFLSNGFRKTNYSELSKRYGKLGAINMYRKMLIVSGEIVLYKDMAPTLSGT